MSRGELKRLCVGAALLILTAAALIALGAVKNSFSGQFAAERWQSADNRYAQLSCFIDTHEDCSESTIKSLESSINKQMASEAIDLSWTFCYSGDTTLSVSRGSNTVSARAICTGGDFFMFNPPKMVSGWYYNDDSINGDGVVLDIQLAWKLFGGYNLTGMTVTINGHNCPVTGVAYPPENSIEKKLYGDTPTIYVPYSLFSVTDTTAPSVTNFEAVLPNPVTNFAMGMLEKSVSFSEQGRELKENTGRMGLIPGLKMLAEFGTRNQKTTAVYYPYWENAARAGESWCTLLAALAVLFAIFPIVLAGIYLAKLIGLLKAAAIKQKNKIIG